MVTRNIIQQAVDLLSEAVPDATIILFGSQARGTAREESDFDLLVIEPTLDSRRKEMVRLSDILRPLRCRVDIVVVSKETFDAWRDTPGTLIYEASREGEVLYVAA